MDKETQSVLSDLLDAVDRLTELVRELNPGADLRLVDMVIERADQTLARVEAQR